MTPIETRVFSNTGRPVTMSASGGVAISASDTDVFSPASLFVGTGGTIKVKFADSDTPVVLKNIPDGTFLPIIITMVYATDTVTATDFVLLY